jgi:hypothetical protein
VNEYGSVLTVYILIFSADQCQSGTAVITSAAVEVKVQNFLTLPRKPKIKKTNMKSG